MFLVHRNLLSLLLAISLVSGKDYCQRDLCHGKHIACDNVGKFASSCPKTRRLLSPTAKDHEQMVQFHNEVRQKWASGNGKLKLIACRMATMHYDDDLAKLAEYNVKQCVMEHDCHNTKKYKISGQNLFTIYAGYTLKLNVSEVFQKATNSWIKEADHVTADQLKSYFSNRSGPVVGHFTAMTRESSNAVGCAASFFGDDSNSKMLVACNYATTNFVGEPIYASCSKAANNCTTGTNPKYSALCSEKEEYVY